MKKILIGILITIFSICANAANWTFSKKTDEFTNKSSCNLNSNLHQDFDLYINGESVSVFFNKDELQLPYTFLSVKTDTSDAEPHEYPMNSTQLRAAIISKSNDKLNKLPALMNDLHEGFFSGRVIGTRENYLKFKQTPELKIALQKFDDCLDGLLKK